jgi:uncharacterized membrane protein
MLINQKRTKTERYARRRHRYEVGGGALGALGGAGLGALAGGPPGAVVGAVIGASVGALTAWANHTGTEEAADRDSKLDLEIGVTSDELGVADPETAASADAAPSRAASGVGESTTPTGASGPFLRPPV